LVRIGLDVDGVLADLVGMIIKIYYEETGLKINRSFITEWEFWRKLSMTRQQFVDMIVKAWRRWPEMEATEDDLAEDVEALWRYGVVDILTQRPAETVNYVKNWLKHHRIRYNVFRWVPMKTSKANFTYDVYVDDSPRLAEKIRVTNRILLLYSQPWNTDVKDGGNIIRVKSLDEAVDRLESITF